MVYDGPGMFSAPRVWWMLRIFGAGNAYVLDGGFDAWKLQGLPVETGKPTAPARASFTATVNSAAVTSFDDMRALVDAPTAQIADRARPRPVHRRRAGATRRHALGPHARRPQRAFS